MVIKLTPKGNGTEKDEKDENKNKKLWQEFMYQRSVRIYSRLVPKYGFHYTDLKRLNL